MISIHPVCQAGGSSWLRAVYYETGTAFRKPVFEAGTISTPEGEKVVDSESLGIGLFSTPYIHAGQQDEGKIGVEMQGSRGDVLQLEITPPLKIRSGFKSWQETTK